MEPLPILYQDKNLVAINKPSGLLVHRSDIDRYEFKNAVKMLRDQIGQWVYPIHRLDKPTSGVLLFGLSSEAAHFMVNIFKKKEMTKSYFAVVRGYTQETERIDYSLQEQHDKMTDSLADSNKEAQTAITEYQLIEKVELPFAVGRYKTTRYSLIKATPLTGRNRQLRRHLKHIFHPIVGDTSHGDGKQNKFFRQHFQCHRLLLHASELSFFHPILEKTINIEAPFDLEFRRILTALFPSNPKILAL